MQSHGKTNFMNNGQDRNHKSKGKKLGETSVQNGSIKDNKQSFASKMTNMKTMLINTKNNIQGIIGSSILNTNELGGKSLSDKALVNNISAKNIAELFDSTHTNFRNTDKGKLFQNNTTRGKESNKISLSHLKKMLKQDRKSVV